MNIARIILDFMYATDPVLLAQSKRIYSRMLENPNFEQPDPPLAILSGAIEAYLQALNAATGGEPFGSIKNEKKLELQNMLLLLSFSVTGMAMGNRAKLESSGFTISPTKRSAGLIGTVNDFRVEQGLIPGSMIAQCDGVLNVRNYTFQYAPAPVGPDTKWEQILSSDRKVTIPDLDSLKAYCFRVIARGTKNQIVYSETITKGVA